MGLVPGVEQSRARRHVRMHIGPRRAAALAVLLRHLVEAEAFMVLRVEVVAEAKLRLLRGLQEDILPRLETELGRHLAETELESTRAALMMHLL